MEEEIWKDVVGFEGKYQVSNLGNVRSLNYRGLDHIKNLKKQKIPPRGYYGVLFNSNSKKLHKYIHRLVAEAFIHNPNNLPEVNHKDEDKQNNHVNNLEWCDSKYNSNYGIRNNIIQQKVIYKRGRPVKCINTGEVFRTITDAGRSKHIKSLGNIVSCCKGERYSTKGYSWSYITLEEYNATISD